VETYFPHEAPVLAGVPELHSAELKPVLVPPLKNNSSCRKPAISSSAGQRDEACRAKFWLYCRRLSIRLVLDGM